MSLPNIEAIRRTAAEVDALAARLDERSRQAEDAVRQAAWAGARRDAFVLGITELGAQARGHVVALRTLAADLRALAGEVEQRIALLRRIEAAVRAELRGLIEVARTALSIVEQELRAVAAALSVVPGTQGIEHRVASARRRLHRLLTIQAQLPPPDDIRWEGVGRAWAAGALLR